MVGMFGIERIVGLVPARHPLGKWRVVFLTKTFPRSSQHGTIAEG